MNFSADPSLDEIPPPDYGTLLDWWAAWPDGRPELLDFWARGNFTRRLLDRARGKRAGFVVRAQYLDEIEAALRRLALLGIEVDIAWTGPVSPPGLVMAPQHVNYESAGGWGYVTCAGDEIDDGSGNWDWCPALSRAILLPDTVTDWMDGEAADFLRSGQVIVCPIENLGLQSTQETKSDEHLLAIGNSASIARATSLAKVIFELDLPVLEGLTVRDTFSFCEDHQDSLVRLRQAISKMIGEGSDLNSEHKIQGIIAEIEDSVAELRLSDTSLSARKSLTSLGAAISTFGVTLGVQLGLAAGAAAVGSVAAAMAVLQMWYQNLQSRAEQKRNPFHAIWELQKVGGPKVGWRSRGGPWRLLSQIESKNEGAPADRLPPYHWLTQPSAGWIVPSARR